MGDILLDNVSYTVTAKHLRDWLTLEEIKAELGQAVGHKDRERVASALCLYVSTAFGLIQQDVSELPWDQVATAFSATYQANEIDLSHLAFTRVKDRPAKDEAWDYAGRSWWTWVHDLSKAFGWTIEYIASLPVLDAFSLFQEILLDQYFTREWQWTLSEYSLKYNSNTKKSEPNPLPKPEWMKMRDQPAEPASPALVPKEFVPVGNVVTWKDIKH